MRPVLMIVNSLSHGGAERTVSELSISLSGRFDVTVLVNSREETTYPYQGTLLSIGLPADADKTKLLYQMKLLAARVRMIRKWKKEHPDGVSVSFSENAALASILAGSANTVLSVRISLENGKSGALRRLFMPIYGLICRKAGYLAPVSEEIALELMNKFRIPAQKIRVLPNGADTVYIRKRGAEPMTPDEEILAGDGPFAVTMGRLVPLKGMGHLIRAFSIVRDAGEPCRLLILGKGPEQRELEKLACGLGLEEQVRFCGFRENPHRLMSRAAAAVLPSLCEGYSNMILESLALGLPVISTDHPTGAKEILDPGAPILPHLSEGSTDAPYGILVPMSPGRGLDPSEPLSPQEREMGIQILRVLRDSDLNKKYRGAALSRGDSLSLPRAAAAWGSFLESIQ